MRLRFRPEARLDLLEASAWYEDRSRGLGTEFVRAVDVTTAGILRFPESFPTVYENVRMAVLGCFHHRRDPTDWRGRHD